MREALPQLCEKSDERANTAAGSRLKALLPLCEKGDVRVIAVAASRLEDGNLDIRKGCTEGLAEAVLCEKSDERAVVAVATRLGALPPLCEKGDVRAVIAVASRLEDGDSDVKKGCSEGFAEAVR